MISESKKFGKHKPQKGEDLTRVRQKGNTGCFNNTAKYFKMHKTKKHVSKKAFHPRYTVLRFKKINYF